MSFGDFLKTGKGKAITIGGVAVVAVGITAAVLMQGDGYRTISVEAVTGTVNVFGEKNNGAAYTGERLYSGDDVSVLDASELTMCMDSDKYVYADANTHFSLEASGPKDDSKIRINLDQGSELNVLESKLGPNDTYEVDTPNSTMSVRGTTFRVTVYTEDGLTYTLLEVADGLVFVRLKTQDGTYNGVEREFGPGESALIRGNSDFSEFVTVDKAELADTDESEEVLMLHYESLPENSVERLIVLIKEGELSAAGSDDAADETTEAEGNDDDSDNESESAAAETDTDSDDGSGDADVTDGGESTDAGAADAASDTNATSNKNTSAQNTKKTHTHTAGGWEIETAPTCQAEGTRVQKCTSCGKVMNTESIPKIGHIAGDWKTFGYPSCGVKGAKGKYCTMCGTLMETADIPALSHEWGPYDDNGNRSCGLCGAVEGGGPVASIHTASTEPDTSGGTGGGGTNNGFPGMQVGVCGNCGTTYFIGLTSTCPNCGQPVP